MADPFADGTVRICDGNKGENLELCEDYLLARRTASFYHSSCYLANPLRETMMRIGEQTHIGYSIALEIVEVEDWAGGLKLGFTVTNPSDIQFASIHITEVPYMCGFDFDGAMVTSNVVDAVGVQTNGPSQTLPHRHTKTDKVRAILSLSTKKLLLEFNETIVPMDFPVPESVKWAGLTSGTPVWGLIEPYGQTKTVRINPHLVPLEWSPERHYEFPLAFRQAVQTIFLLSLPKDGYSRFDNVWFYLLPKELLFVIVEQMAISWLAP